MPAADNLSTGTSKRYYIQMVHLFVWLLAAAMYAPIFFNLYKMRWDKVDYTHAYFILPISLWLIWHKRKEIKETYQQAETNNMHFLSFPLLLLGMIMFIVGWRQDYLFISTLSLVPSLFGLIIFLYGIQIAKKLLFPIFYILLLVPPPFAILDSITLPMRHSISAVTELILRTFDYPISRDGLLLTIGYNDIFMGQPCSGFRSLITMFSLVLVYVYISKGNISKKIILTFFILPLALLGNLVRVITLCLITFYFGEEAGQGFFHNFSGIVIFIITILGLLSVESTLDKLQGAGSKLT